MSVNGDKVGESRVNMTQLMVFSADETTDVGLDNRTPVAERIGVGRDNTRFTGMIHQPGASHEKVFNHRRGDAEVSRSATKSTGAQV